MKKALLWNVLLLTASSLLLRTVSISFRVYISNKIGAEGMGLYQLILSIYALASTFATSGISLAVCRLVSEEIGRGSRANIKRILDYSFCFSLVLSVTVSFLLFNFSDYVGNIFLKDNRTILPLKILAPSLPFMALSSCLKGYFYAVRKIIKPVSSQILEQLIKITVIFYILSLWLPRGLEYACSAIVLGITASELFSCLYVFVLYYLEHNSFIKSRKSSLNAFDIIKNILYISLPVAASSYLRSSLRTIENILIPAGFKKFGSTNESSLSVYGMLTGMVMPVLSFPSAFLSAFSALLVPEISEANATKNKTRVNYAISRVFQITLLFSFLVTGVFMTFSKELGLVIYNDQDTGILLLILTPLVPLMYLDRVVDGMLKGLNQQVSSLKYNIIDSVLRIGLIYYLLPVKGITGFIIVIYTSNIINSYLSIRRLLRVTRLKINIADWILYPSLAAASVGMLIPFGYHLLHIDNLSSGLGVTVGITIFSLLYLIFLYLLQSISSDDVSWFKSIFIK